MITKERLIKILEQFIHEESEAIETYEKLADDIIYDEALPKYLRQDLSNDLYSITADEEMHKEILERHLFKLKDFKKTETLPWKIR